MKRVVISGAGGFIGTELCKKMIKNGIEVVAVSLFFDPSFPQDPLIIRKENDISDLNELLSTIPEGPYDAFYHLAWRGVNGPEKADPYIQLNNIKTALICADAAKELNCKSFLCSGTIAEKSIESLPLIETTKGEMMYGAAKHCTNIILETYCKNIGLDFVWMQFSNIYGPQNKTGNLVSYTISQLTKNEEAVFGPAVQSYDFIYIDDLIEAVYRLGFHRTTSHFYFIGSGKPRQLKEYLLEIGKAYGKENLIRIGKRPDDGIVYTYDMFDSSKLVEDVGEYVSKGFSEWIKYTIENY